MFFVPNKSFDKLVSQELLKRSYSKANLNELSRVLAKISWKHTLEINQKYKTGHFILS